MAFIVTRSSSAPQATVKYRQKFAANTQPKFVDSDRLNTDAVNCVKSLFVSSTVAYHSYYLLCIQSINQSINLIFYVA